MNESDTPASREDIRRVLSSVYHDLNNPLSIISGNAQFLLELSREEDLDEQFVSAVKDVQEAAQRMSDSLDRLTRLKEELEQDN